MPADEKQAMATFWTQGGLPLDAGALAWLAEVLLEHPREQWRQAAETFLPSIADVFVAHGGWPVDEARRKAATVVIEAPIEAQQFAELKAQKSAKAGANGTNGNGTSRIVIEHIGAVVHRVVKSAEHPAETVPTPFPRLNDLLLGGFRRGELIYLGARPSIGKSALAAGLILHAANRGMAAALVSREMTNEAQCARVLAQAGRLDAASLRTGRGVQWSDLARTAERVSKAPIYLTDKADTLEQIAAAAQQVANLRLVVVDYLQLLSAPKAIRDRRAQIEALSAGLKQIAMKTDVPIVALSSLSRPNGAVTDKRPSLASLRESGMLEHDADIVLLMHRDKDGAETECMVAKNRDGRTGVVHLVFRPQWVGFDELATEDEDGTDNRYPD